MAKVTKPPPPDHLTLQLFAPGMSLLHRAGLGGLACTLKAIERQFEAGQLAKSKLPSPFVDGTPPWEIDEQSVTLKFGKPEKAGDYLKRLFEYAFQIRDGLIHLPGQYGDTIPTSPVRAAIQDGIQNTFLQHGPTCGSRSGERTVTIEVDDKPFTYTHDVFTSYKHQGWFWLDRDERSKDTDPTTGKKVKTGRRNQNHQGLPAVNDDGELSGEWHEIDNKIFPGGIVRHDRFKQSAILESDAGLICLHFSMVGCLTLSVNRVTAVLLVPDIVSLVEFVEFRRWLTPATLYECRIANAADAALQAQVRLRARQSADTIQVPACYALTCKPTKWNEKQKPRVATIAVPIGSNSVLDRFARALSWLPPRLVLPKAEEAKTKRTRKKDDPKSFWSDSVVRPLIAENLALGRKWYTGFIELMTKVNPATGKPYREQLTYPEERKGLHAMISDPAMWDHEGESLVVKAVHEAILYTRGRIKRETDGEGTGPPSPATRKRWERFEDRVRIDLSGSKTADQVRHALANLFSRAGKLPSLQKGWQTLLPMLADHNWQRARDLGLLGLASYAGKGAPESDSAA